MLHQLRTAEIFRARILRISCLGFSVFASSISAAAEPADSAEFFEKRIRPVLSEQCFKCHSSTSEKLKGGLMLDSREAWLKGGDTGPAITPGDPEKSLLVEAIRWKNTDMQMPPKKALAPQQIADIDAWVKAGAPWPQTADSPSPNAGAKVATKKIFDLQQRRQEHWCWQPVVNSPVPAVKDSAWPRTDADHFILAKLEEKGLKPAPDADAATLLRRLTFAITGLPPTAEQIAKFTREFGDTTAADDKVTRRQGDKVNDANHPLTLSPPHPVTERSTQQQRALEHLVDSLLASPHFGERWARHWLDLVRYAETRGHEFDPEIPNAWQYRDYVIRALNSDVPYDRFAAEHIAGDLLPPRYNVQAGAQTGANESILGTGFWFLGEEVHSPVDIRQDETDRMDNRLDVMSKTFLGVTVACARCHDHKFDAISQRDYYALAGFLISSGYRQARFETMEQEKQIAQELDQLRHGAQPQLLKACAQAEAKGVAHTAELLLAAREVLRGTKARDVAARRSLDASSLETWAAELSKAKADAQHPFHLFAKIATEKKKDDPAEFAKHFTALLAKSKMKTDAPMLPEGAGIVVNFANRETQTLMQDGVSFGLQPLLPGDAIFGSTVGQPLLGVSTRGAACRDPIWKKLTNKSAEQDFGTLGKWQRAGQTLRTPEVTLAAKSLWYLVKGSGRAYAVVNSHLVIKGPLHGAVLKEWKADDGRWQWVEHSLPAYEGHRTHVEFSPNGAEDFAIAMVVQSDSPPSLPQNWNSLLVAELGGANVNGPEALAQTTQRTLASACESLGKGAISTDANAADRAEFADWLVRNLDLFCPPGSAARKQLSNAARPFIAKQADIAARIRPDSHTAPAMFDGSGADEFVLTRGSSKLPGAQVPRRFLEAIAGPEQLPITGGSGRLELARKIADPTNPLTARAIVNRVWHHLFGRGIAATVDNFGVLGQAPSHPELLGHLAARFVGEQAWSLKKLIRELLLSHTYQMSSQPADTAAEQADPENILLHRMNLRRLEGEAIRDAVLAVSGRINPKLGGPSVPVHLTPFMDGRGKPSRSGPLDGDGRRSIYISVRRNFLQPMMLAFDTPIPFNTMGRRNVSNVPAQALILMNDPFIVEQAKNWARHLPAADARSRIAQMYLAAFSRPPTPDELADATAFLQTQSALYAAKDPNDPRVWADLCHVLFNVKEFIHLN